MAQKGLTPSMSPANKQSKYKPEVKTDRMSFDETSKYLDYLFEEDKWQMMAAQFKKHARDQYKCFCQICVKNNPNLKEESPNKLTRQFYMTQTSPFKVTNQSFHQQNLYATNTTNLGEAHINNDLVGKINETEIDFNLNTQHAPLDASAIPKSHDTELNFILRRLVPPQRVQRTLRILVPETVLFWSGEAKLMIYTNYKDNQLKFVKQKEKLQLNEIRKFFNERRSKYRQLVDQKLEEMRIFGPNEARFIKRPQEIKLFDTCNSTPTNKNDNTGTNKKEMTKFSHVKKSKLATANSGDASKNSNPSPQSSQTNNNTNESPNNGMTDSQIKNGDQKRPKTSGGKPSENQIGSTTGTNNPNMQTIENKDAIIYKLDSYSKYDQDHTTVINESDFLTLMMKRKVFY